MDSDYVRIVYVCSVSVNGDLTLLWLYICLNLSKMFSGLTNQVSSWMGGTGKKEDLSKSEDEKLSSPIAETDSGSNIEGEKKDAR